jgi:hypothetical protein
MKRQLLGVTTLLFLLMLACGTVTTNVSPTSSTPVAAGTTATTQTAGETAIIPVAQEATAVPVLTDGGDLQETLVELYEHANPAVVFILTQLRS